jgi:dihydropyrimidinase
MTSLLVKNGQVVTAAKSVVCDILVIKNKIAAKGKNLEKADSHTRIIDAAGLYVLPGGIDPHVHMELPVGEGQYSSDDFETGTRAALAGGTTSIIDFVTPESGQSLIDALNERKKLAKKSLCDYGLHMSITGWNEGIPEEMRTCVEREGTPSFKVYMAYKETIGLEDAHLIAVMDTAAKLNARVIIHCEHDEIIRYLQAKFIAEGKTSPQYHPLSRPPEVEGEAVGRALLMAKHTGCPLYIVHVSTRDGVEKIARARSSGQDVLAETCSHHLLLDETEYSRPGFEGAAYVMSPPLRPKHHNNALWKAIRAGDIQTAATDHCPFHMKGQKDRGISDFTKIPNGVAGVENRVALLYTYGVLKKKISLCQWVNICAAAPAKIFGLYPRKGTIEIGADADLLLWDPHKESTISARTHHHHCDTSIYEGFLIKGNPHMVITNGTIAFESGSIKVERGSGCYLYRQLI